MRDAQGHDLGEQFIITTGTKTRSSIADIINIIVDLIKWIRAIKNKRGIVDISN